MADNQVSMTEVRCNSSSFSLENGNAGVSGPLSSVSRINDNFSASGQLLLEGVSNGHTNVEKPNTRYEAASSLIQTLFRSLRTNLIKNIIASRWDTNLTEQPKIAIHKDRLQAILQCGIHLIPVSAALALVALNISQYYVGGELAGASGQDDEKLGALQFAAKLHELLMIASLAAVVFTYIRRELVFGEGIPYGALAAGLEIDNFSFLYSSELWSAFWSKWERRRKKWALVALLISCTLLGASVGPSTANLMRPRLDYWPAGGTEFWTDASSDSLQPLDQEFHHALSHCAQDTNDPACPHGDWQLLARQYHAYWVALKPMGSMPETIALNSPLSSRTMVVRHRSTEFQDTRSIWQNAYSSATTQQSVVADGVSETGRLWAYAAANAETRQKFLFRRDAKYSTNAPQPVTQARCSEHVVENNRFEGLQIRFPVLKIPACSGDSSTCFADPEEEVACNNSSFAAMVRDGIETIPHPSVFWADNSICQIPRNSSLAAVVAFPETNLGGPRIYLCTIDSRLANTTISSTRNNPKVVTGYPRDFLSLGTNNPAWPRTAIRAEWANLLYPDIPGQNSTAFSIMASAAGMWNSSLHSEPYNYLFTVEAILATSVANGIARTTYNNAIVGNLKGISAQDDGAWDRGSWMEQLLPKHSLGWGGAAYADTPADTSNSTRLLMHATVLGYAWSHQGMLQKANIIVLLIYSAFVLVHFVYSSITGWTSTSWDTTTEIMALAMNSGRTDMLRNTGAGIDTVNPLKQKVRIRCFDFHLAYVFEDTIDTAQPLRSNKGYK